MVKASKGLRRGTRRKLKKGRRDKFKPETFIQDFKPGDKVIIRINPSSRKAMIHSRYNGKIGTVKCKRGGAFMVNAYLGRKKREIYISPEHLKRL